LLAEHFLEEAVSTHRLTPRRFTAETLACFDRYPWPGNIRELRHVVESAAILSNGPEIGLAELPAELGVGSPAMLRSAAEKGLSLDQLEQAYIREVLHRTKGNKSAAARILGIHRKTLHEKLRSRE
jgi:DNA-binding NtrC family response regulator